MTKEDMEHVEISAILDVNGNTVEDFDKKNKTFESKDNNGFKLKSIVAIIFAIILLLTIISVMLVVIPVIIGIALLGAIIQKLINFIRNTKR